MRKPELIETRPVALDEIVEENRLRPVDPLAVESIKASIEEIGLQDEIHLRKVRLKPPYKDGVKSKLVLLAGGHRLQAFRDLGREAIPAKIWDCTNDYARLIEVDDNLARSDLQPLDLALFLVERKRVYEEMYPHTKRGAMGVSGALNPLTDTMSVRGGEDTAEEISVVSFVAATADKYGQSERNVRRIVAAGQALDPDTIQALRAAPKRVTLKDLQVLSKSGDPDQRAFICEALAEGRARNAMDALRQHRAETTPGNTKLDPEDAKALKLSEMFSRSNKAVKRRFLRLIQNEAREILAELEQEADRGSFASRRGA